MEKVNLDGILKELSLAVSIVPGLAFLDASFKWIPRHCSSSVMVEE